VKHGRLSIPQKNRTIHGIVVPCGYTLVPSAIFKEACNFIRLNNFVLFKSLAQYNIWHNNDPINPPATQIHGSTQLISNE